jgi:hypothetical protein
MFQLAIKNGPAIAMTSAKKVASGISQAERFQ